MCSSVNLGSTKTGIDMDAVRLMGDIIRETAELTKENDSIGCSKLVVFCVTKSSEVLQAEPPTSAIGVTDIRLFTIGTCGILQCA